MGSKDSFSFWFRVVIVLTILACMSPSIATGLPVAAQNSDTSAVDSTGSPESEIDTSAQGQQIDEPSIEENPLEQVAVTSLVPPVEIVIDSTGSGAMSDPCAAIDARWAAVLISPLVDWLWVSSDGLSGGNITVDTTSEPVSFGWDALNGGAVFAAIVPNWLGDPAVLANLYDYRAFGGAIGGDAGLIAPSETLSVAYLCVLAPMPTATLAPIEVSSETPESIEPVDESTASVTATRGVQTSDANVAPAAIGIGSSVRVAEPLNLRSSPSITGGVITVLSTGTIVTVVGGPQTASGYTWWQLSTPSGTGWSVVDYLIEQPVASTPTRTATRTPSASPTVRTGGGIALGGSVRVTQLLNLRQAAGTSSTVLAVMPAGTTGTVLAGPQSANGMSWWRISTSLGTGWAAGNYLAPVAGSLTPIPTRTATPSATTSASTTSPTVSRTTQPSGIAIGDLVRTTTRVNLRAAAGTGAAVVTILATGSQGSVIGGPTNATGYVWWQLSTASGTGWVAAPYLTRVGVAPTGTATRTATGSPAATGTPTATPTPSMTPTRSITSVATGTSSPSVTRTPSRTATSTLVASVTPTVGQCGSLRYGDIARTNSSVNFRSTPSTAGTIIRTLSQGEQGTVRGGPATANGYTWCQIQIGSTTGWVANTFLTRVSGPLPTPNGTITPRPDPPGDPGTGSASVVYKGSTSSGMIALTYDAGADRGRAEYILDMLAQYGVHATFGMTGTWARDNPDLVARMVAEGHQLINHTWSHPSFTGGSSSTTVLTRTARLDQLDRAEAIVEQQTGYQMQPYWRPPYGDINASVLRDVYAGGYRVTVMWSCDSLAWNGATEQQILNRCMYPMGAGDIILLHVGADGLDWAATDNMIEYFLGRGLQLVTIEEMIGG